MGIQLSDNMIEFPPKNHRFAVWDKNTRIIYGIGLTEELAIADAKENADQYTEDPLKGLDVHKCTIDVYEYVSSHGHNGEPKVQLTNNIISF